MVRTKRSLRAFREAWEGLKMLVQGLARMGIIPLPPLRDHGEEETAGSKAGRKNGSKNGPKNSVQGAGALRGKGPGRRRQHSRGWVCGSCLGSSWRAMQHRVMRSHNSLVSCRRAGGRAGRTEAARKPST